MIGSSTFLRADCVGVFFRLQMVNPDIDKRASKLFQSIQSLTSATEIKLRLILHWLHGYYINQDPYTVFENHQKCPTQIFTPNNRPEILLFILNKPQFEML